MTLPNILTTLRIALVPVIVLLLFADRGNEAARWWALALFITSAITDYLDGWLARRLQQESRIGRMLDPIADKLLVALVLLALVATGEISGWHLLAVFAVIFREVLVSGLRESLAGDRVELPVSLLAKYKTAIQMIALALLIGSPAVPGVASAVPLGALWVAAILTLATGLSYLVEALRHVRNTSNG